MVEGSKYYDEKLNAGGQKRATVRYGSWIVVEVADTENGNPRLLSKKTQTKSVEESKGDETVCWKELKTSWMYMDDENRIDEVLMAN